MSRLKTITGNVLETTIAMKHSPKLVSKVFAELNKGEKILTEKEYQEIINKNIIGNLGDKYVVATRNDRD